MRAKAKIISDINYLGLIAVVRTDKTANVIPLCEALVAGGVSAIELTMTIPDALNTIKAAVAHFGARAMFGAGTVLDAKTAKSVIDAGAEFVVSPITKVEIAGMCRAANRPVMLGAYTPTEAQLAHDAGADYVKLFPADGLGTSYIKALHGPLPHLRIVPTGGITLENLGDFLKAGCPAVGVGSSLTTKEILQSANWTELTRLAREFVGAVQKARGK
jgi:2-dehydro-3-deoxyphosphogluconate aldolase/(4S)-4-hydroxy-2-oxoglutarate aldolase